MAKKIDPLNKKEFGGVSVILTVRDVAAAAKFYQKALGFKKRAEMKGPGGKILHIELDLRGSILMLGAESVERGQRSAGSIGGTPATLYMYAENVDKVVAKAVTLGATAPSPVMDMFWGDRCGMLVDPDGNAWMIGTHKEDPTPAEVRKRMKQQMSAAAG